MLNKAQETKLWEIKSAGYDYYKAKFDKEALDLADAIRHLVDDILVKNDCNPIVLVH